MRKRRTRLLGEEGEMEEADRRALRHRHQKIDLPSHYEHLNETETMLKIVEINANISLKFLLKNIFLYKI